jgi:hypothetical protein
MVSAIRPVMLESLFGSAVSIRRSAPEPLSPGIGEER